MGVMKEGLHAWPDTVAYKRMLRNMIRAQEYVPPQQPTGTGPLPEGVAATPPGTSAHEGNGAEAYLAAADDQVAAPETAPAASRPPEPVQIGQWVLRQNDQGDLIAYHPSGVEVVLADNPERNERG